MGKIKTLYEKIAGISLIDTLYKFITFHDFFKAAFRPCLRMAIRRDRRRQERFCDQLRKKQTLTVLFFLQSESVWKCDTLYRLMEKSSRFRPVVVVSPYNVHLIYDFSECLSVMRKALDFAQKQQYNVVSAYDFDSRRWTDVKKTVNPDIVFFSKPYKDTLPQYHLYHFRDRLTLYVPYGIVCIDLFRNNYNLVFQNLLWRHMVETQFQKDLAVEHSECRGDNVVVVGALAMEKVMDPSYRPTDVWKPQPVPKKRVIWAPHHTVDYLFNFSNFLVYCDSMLELAAKYRDQVQFAFKPHPVLKFKLLNLWGKEKTEAYYRKWQELDSTQLAEGDYMDLFITSDAMIHDSVSFTAEYLYTRKPALFLLRDPEVLTHWNPFGKKCFDMHYKAECREEIERFLVEVVINGNDTLNAERERFFRESLSPDDGMLPSQRICEYLNLNLMP